MPDSLQSIYRSDLPWVQFLFAFFALANGAAGANSAGRLADTDITKAVISSLPASPGKHANVIATVDLTQSFQPPTQWTFMKAILPGSHFDGADENPVDGGALALCFVAGLTPHCSYGSLLGDADRFSTPIALYSARVVFAGAGDTDPLLLIKAGGAHSGDGSHAIHTVLYSYDRRSNRFVEVFSNVTGSNNNQETRFIEGGPLRGDIIVAEPTSSAPFGFWISVYVNNPTDSNFRRFLRYRSATRYNDGNHLAVIDSEIAGILQRMSLWKPGDPLPAPSQCTRLALRRGEIWCQES